MWIFHLQPDLKGWITLGVFAVIELYIFRQIYLDFQNTRHNKKATERKPPTSRASPNKRNDVAPSEETFSNADANELERAETMIPIARRYMRVIHHFCSFIRHLLSKISKIKTI